MEIRNRFDLMDETIPSNNMSEFQKKANVFETSLIHSSEKIHEKNLRISIID